MNFEEDASGSEAESGGNSGSGSGSEYGGVADLAFASTTASSSFFLNNSSEDEAPAYFFMAKASKVSSKKPSYDTSDYSSVNTDSEVSYNKLSKIVSIQQDELEKQCKAIKKSEGFLIDEMEKNQIFTNEQAALKEKFEELSTRHDLLSADHEKLTYEFLQSKMALEKLKEAHEKLENINLSLMAQNTPGDKINFVPP